VANEIASFWWQIPKNGFKWVETKILVDDRGNPAYSSLNERCQVGDKPRLAMTDGILLGQRYTFTRYNPLVVATGLFRTFAQIPVDDKDVMLAFANQYGRLGMTVWLDNTRTVVDQPLPPNGGELFEDWVQEIDRMKHAVQLWTLTVERNTKELCRYLHWEPGQFSAEEPTLNIRAEGWYFDSHPELGPNLVPPQKGIRERAYIQPVDGVAFGNDDPVLPAMFLVQRWVNAQLKERVAPQLLYDVASGTQMPQFVPKSLLGAMWLQFAFAIAGDKQYRACKVCKKWFEISGQHRITRQFCSDACKTKDFRTRKIQGLTTKFVAEGQAALRKLESANKKETKKKRRRRRT